MTRKEGIDSIKGKAIVTIVLIIIAVGLELRALVKFIKLIVSVPKQSPS